MKIFIKQFLLPGNVDTKLECVCLSLHRYVYVTQLRIFDIGLNPGSCVRLTPGDHNEMFSILADH
jgi:hypothetical protein